MLCPVCRRVVRKTVCSNILFLRYVVTMLIERRVAEDIPRLNQEPRTDGWSLASVFLRQEIMVE